MDNQTNESETTYTYNLYGNPLRRWAEKAGAVTEELSERYEYMLEGLLKSAISMSTASGGMRYSYTYDGMGRLTEKKASGRTLLSFTYDLNGNLTGQTDVSGKTTEYRYDKVDRITEVWDNGKKVAGYEYNPDGTVKNLYCGNLHTAYAYDADRNLSSLKTLLGDQVLADNSYRYDGNGNRIEKRQKQGTTTYTYDAVNRLSTVEYPGRREELFYDKAGNRTRRVTNGMEELYRYDGRNRLQEYTNGGNTTKFEYDKAGNLLRDDKASYKYDAFNRTHKVETFDGNIQINRYDTEGLRHEMEENGKLVQFIFRGTEVVAEESQESRIRYIRTGELLASDAEYARTYYHYASDEMGSITHVTAGVAKEEEGEKEEPPGVKILNQYEYDAWGNVTACEETVENRFRFNGQQYDPVAQQYYLRARFYNPVIGRFTQEDTYRGDGLNLYTYCRNNPVYYVDPSGHICDAEANRIRQRIADGTATAGERRKLEAYERNKARKQSGAGSVGNGSENLEGGSSSKKPIKPYEVTTYEDFQNRSVPGDGLEGHEIWQHANLNENGYATTRLSTETSKKNPVMALPHEVHTDVNRAQRAIDARAQSPIDNIKANANILYNHSKVPNTQIDKQLGNALQHYNNTVKGKNINE